MVPVSSVFVLTVAVGILGKAHLRPLTFNL